eukprot:g46662.t1
MTCAPGQGVKNIGRVTVKKMEEGHLKQYERFLKISEEKGGEGPLSVLNAMSLFVQRSRMVTIQMYNTYVPAADVLTVLGRSAPGSVIYPDQTCAVPGRRIAESLALLRDMIACVQDSGVDTCLINLNQEKAFDKILHTYMRDVLSKMGFGEGICNWIQQLYTNIVSTASINGWESESFPNRSGVRQGCPLSPALFVCCIEPFPESIRKDASLRRVTILGSGGLQVKAFLYMDAVAVFCSDPQSVNRLVSNCNQFVLALGAKVNRGKSKVMLFGNWANQFTGKTDYPKVLGIWFRRARACAKTWEEHVTKVRQKLGRWEHRSLSIVGKSLVIRCEVLSVLLYMAQVWLIPRTYTAAVTQAIFHFIWSIAKDRNAQNSWTVPYHLSFLEKFVKKNTFDHKSIRQWSARSVLETLREKEEMDLVEWFPVQTVKVIWQNTSSPELSNKHQDIVG